MRYTIVFVLFFQVVSGQQLDFKINHVDVNDNGVEVHFNEHYHMDGKAKVYRIYGTDTLFTFKGKVKDNYLYDTAYWYNDSKKLSARACFILPETVREHTDTNLFLWPICMRGILQGEYIQWFADKDYPYIVAYYKQGKKDGLYTIYHPNGTFAQMVMYSNGKKHGRFEQQDANGGNYVSGAFNEGQKWGKWEYYYDSLHLKQREWYGQNSKRDSMIVYATNGQLLERVHFFRDESISENHTYTEGGKLLRYEHYSFGKQDSLEIWFHANGQKESEVHFVNGRKEGKYRSWYQNGKPNQEYTFLDGQREGVYVSKYPNGKFKARGAYHDNRKVEVWHHYAPNGQLLRSMTPEMELEEELIEEPEMLMAVAEEPEIFDYAYSWQMPGISFYSDTKDDLKFLKKYKSIDLVVKIDRSGSAEYKILSAMKSKDSIRLMVFLNEYQNRWHPCVLNGRPVVSSVRMILTRR